MIALPQTQNRSKSVAFTGHRSFKIDGGVGGFELLAEQLLATLRMLCAQGYDTFYTGMSEGFDLFAAEKFMCLQNEFTHVRLVAAIPYPGQSRAYDTATITSYQQVLAACDERVILSAEYHAGCFHERNKFLIDNSSLLVCFYNGSAGGTKYTVDRAKRKGLRIINIDPSYMVEPQLTMSF